MKKGQVIIVIFSGLMLLFFLNVSIYKIFLCGEKQKCEVNPLFLKIAENKMDKSFPGFVPKGDWKFAETEATRIYIHQEKLTDWRGLFEIFNEKRKLYVVVKRDGSGVIFNEDFRYIQFFPNITLEKGEHI